MVSPTKASSQWRSIKILEFGVQNIDDIVNFIATEKAQLINPAR